MQKTHLYKRCLRALVLVMLLVLPAASLAETYMTVKGGSLNLRKEASLNASVLGQYPTGTWMTVTEEGQEWSKVSVAGKTGYVLTKYLTASGNAGTAYVHTNTGIGLNVRSAPSESGAVLLSVPNGKSVSVVQQGNGWHKVTVDGTLGFMASRYLSVNGGSTGSGSTSGKQGVVNNPGANQVLLLRETASTDARVLGYYRNGTAVSILGESGSFYKVNVAGKTGFMMKKFIKVSSSSVGSSVLPAAPFTAKLVNPNGNAIVNFRKAPGLSSSVIKAYPVGTEITVTEVGDVWCKATIGDAEGYVSRYFFAVVK